MIDYKKMYFTMFNAATNALTILSSYMNFEYPDLIECAAILSNAQFQCEEIYLISSDDEPL